MHDPRAGGIHGILGAVERGKPGTLNLECKTVTGKTIGENIADYDVRAGHAAADAKKWTAVKPGGVQSNQAWSSGEVSVADLAVLEAPTATGHGFRGPAPDGFDPFDVIREVPKAYSQEGGLAVLYGNLAPNCAVVKTARVSPNMMKHEGPAVILKANWMPTTALSSAR